MNIQILSYGICVIISIFIALIAFRAYVIAILFGILLIYGGIYYIKNRKK